MLKKLTEEKKAQILTSGIQLFAKKGIQGTSMAEIARKANTSVGVLYKYYKDKDDFCQACIKSSLLEFESFLNEMVQTEAKILNYAKILVLAAVSYSQRHPDCIRMYHQITVSEQYSSLLTEEIEGFSSRLYIDIISKAQKDGQVRDDLDPRLFAFFLDNLLMMLQYSYCCPYYQNRLKLYCKEEIKEELVMDQMLRFLESAFTFDRDQIVHEEIKK